MAIRKLETAFEEFKAGLFAAAPDLGVPQNIRITKVVYLDAERAVITVEWDAVVGAGGYVVEHEWGNVYAPSMRPIEHVAWTSIVIGGTGPFTVAPGHPYTIDVYATDDAGKRAPVGGVAVLDVPAYAPPEPANPAAVATVQGTLESDSLVVGLAIGAPGADLSTVAPTACVVDTGAFECALDAATAVTLGLPNLGPATVGGVGGSANAFNTKVDVQFGVGGPVYHDVNAVAIESFGQNLWGLRFAIDRGFAVTVNTVTATLTYTKG